MRTLASRILDWLTPGGYVFFRESCFHQSGNKPRDSNPSHYRDPEQYEAMFEVGVVSLFHSHTEHLSLSPWLESMEMIS